MSPRQIAALEFVLIYEALRHVYPSQRDLFADVRLQNMRAAYVRLSLSA